MPEFARLFRLHQPDGRVLHGAEFPSGRVAVDDRMGFYTAVDLSELIASVPSGTRIEWADGEEAADA
ncbi:hypothetical protein [Streptomyces sp. UG1]|uniref:hypothetical protein n=1 Tax=Streptomyces sp. UG1 TaxID=3417652 RepID=UPI003CEEE31B